MCRPPWEAVSVSSQQREATGDGKAVTEGGGEPQMYLLEASSEAEWVH